MKSFFSLIVVFITATFLFSGLAFAQEVGDIDMLSRILQYVKDFGGLGSFAKISGAITLLLSLTKVSFIKPLWDKLGDFKAYAGPALGFLAGLFNAFTGNKFDWAVVAAWTFAGSGSVFLHEILDTIKAIPGVGTLWVTVIEIIKGILKAPAKP